MSSPATIWRVQFEDGVQETDAETLQCWIFDGQVTPAHKVSKGGLSWIEAGRVPALRRTFEDRAMLFGDGPAETPPPATIAAPPATIAAPPAVPQWNEPAQTRAFVPPAEPYIPTLAVNPADARQVNWGTPASPVSDYQPTIAAPPVSGYQPTIAAPPLSEYQPTLAVPVPSSYQDAHTYYTPSGAGSAFFPPPATPQPHAAPGGHAAGPHPDDACYQHPGTLPQYVCRACQTPVCQHCTKYVGNIALCPLCGEMCRNYQDVKKAAARSLRKQEKFGLTDFGKSVLYPFKSGLTVFFLALLYAVLCFFGPATWLFSAGLLFGYMTNVVRQVAQGRWEQSSETLNHEFGMGETFLFPVWRGFCTVIVSWGPCLLLFFMLWTGIAGNYDHNKVNEQKQADLLQAEGYKRMARDMASQNPPTVLEFNRKANELEAKWLKADGAKNEHSLFADLFARLWVAAPGLMRGLLILSLIWAVFYYPMALAVVGYTESGLAGLNPAIGLDTMKRLAGDYPKAFLMYLAIGSLGGFLSKLTFESLAGFTLPVMGNAPARFLDAVITFYACLVISCLLGLLLYKNADALGLATD